MVEKASAEVQEEVRTSNDLDSLRDFVLEAEQVELRKNYNGWTILERDIKQYKSEQYTKLAYLNPKSKEFYEAKVLYLAGVKLLELVNDYAENRKRALELLERIDNTKENIVLDVDN